MAKYNRRNPLTLEKTLLGTTHEYELQLIKLVGIKTKALLEEI